MEAERPKNIFELHVNSIITSRVKFAVMGAQCCSSMTATFLQRHFLIKLNGPRYFFRFVFIGILARQLFLVSEYFEVGVSPLSFDERNLFLSHSYKCCTCGNGISTRFWFALITSLFLVFQIERAWQSASKYLKRWCRGKLRKTMVDSWYCLGRFVLGEMSQVSRRLEVGNHNWRTPNTPRGRYPPMKNKSEQFCWLFFRETMMMIAFIITLGEIM